MEDRRIIHHNGNTVKEELPTVEQLEKNRKAARLPKQALTRVFKEKSYMTTLCAHCGNRGKEYRAICGFCGTCQSCGLRSDDRNVCRPCGNKQDKIKKKAKRRILA